jgi:hypothetical protein
MSLSKQSQAVVLVVVVAVVMKYCVTRLEKQFLRVYSLFKMCVSEQNRLDLSKCEDLTKDEESDEDDSDVTGFGGGYDDDDDDTPLAVPLD